MSNAERKELNLKAGKLIETFGIDIYLTENSFDMLRERDFVGYAHYYLQYCYDKSQLENQADITIYKQLLEIDSKLGTTQTEQLFWCVFWTVRMDLIKV